MATERKTIGLADVRALQPGQTIWDARVIGFGARRQKGPAQQEQLHISAIFPIIFTSSPRSDITPHLSKLEAFQISVFCREDIEQIMLRIEAPPSADEIRTAVQSLIPKSATATPEVTSGL